MLSQRNRTRAPRGAAKTTRAQPGRWRTQPSVWRFAVIFVATLAVFYVLLACEPSDRLVLHPYLNWCARMAAWCLRVLGHDATAAGTVVTSLEYAVNVKRGCDVGYLPTAFLASLVLAVPASPRARGRALAVGLPLLTSSIAFRVAIAILSDGSAEQPGIVPLNSTWRGVASAIEQAFNTKSEAGFVVASLIWILVSIRWARFPTGMFHDT